MTHQQKLEAIRAACVKANPDIVVDEIGHENGEQAPEIERVYREVRLADVLLAVKPHYTNHDYDNDRDRQMVDLWNLHKDDLTEQSDEFVDFAYQLLK